MPSAARIGVVLALLGLCLFPIPLFFITTPSATYYIDARGVDEPREGATVVSLESTDPSVRSNLSKALRSADSVAVGSEHPSVPSYVRHDGQLYSVAVIVGDPGGEAAVVSLGLFGLGIVAFAASVLAFVVAGWRRYRHA